MRSPVLAPDKKDGSERGGEKYNRRACSIRLPVQRIVADDAIGSDAGLAKLRVCVLAALGIYPAFLVFVVLRLV